MLPSVTLCYVTVTVKVFCKAMQCVFLLTIAPRVLPAVIKLCVTVNIQRNVMCVLAESAMLTIAPRVLPAVIDFFHLCRRKPESTLCLLAASDF